VLFLLFHIGRDRYAIDATQVAEVLPMVALKGIPQAPPAVAGAFRYRGAPVPAIDLSQLALGRAASRRMSTRIVLVHYEAGRAGRRLLGLIAEHVTGTIRRDAADFVPSGVSGGPAPYLGPVADDPQGMIQRIELQALLPAPLRDRLFAEEDA
jgi:chemotaxis-related protein WspB